MERPVGLSSVPAMIEKRGSPFGAQNRFEPQNWQKPRRALGDESYQRSPRSSRRTMASRRAAVAAAKWPLVRRHMSQWQATTGRSGPRVSYRTAPQRQPPLCTASDIRVRHGRLLLGDEFVERLVDGGI